MTDDAAQVARLQVEITNLQRAIASLDGLPEAQQSLRERLAATQMQLATLTGQAPPLPPVVQHQSGGINFGVGTRIGAMGDVFTGDKYVFHGPTFNGPVTVGRDLNTANNQTISNSEAPAPPALPTSGFTLRLRLTDPGGQPLPVLLVGAPALLQVELDNTGPLPTLDGELLADATDVEWPEGTRRTLVLRPGIPPRLPAWSFRARQAGTVILRVLVLQGGMLLQYLALNSEAREPGVLAPPPTLPASPPPAPLPPVGFALSDAPRAAQAGRDLTLLLDQEREGYRLLLLEHGSATTGTLALTPQQLDDLLAYARHELHAIVHTVDDATGRHPFQSALAIPEPLAAATLARLAQVGATLWDGLFTGSGSDASSHALGERLRARSQAAALRIDVIAAHLPFPWPLLYDRDPRQAITPDGFWGLRHILAAVPRSGRPRNPDLALGTAGALRALLALNLHIDQATPGWNFADTQRQALRDAGLSLDEANTEAALTQAIAVGSDAQLLYFFGHAASAQPGEQPRPDLPPGVGSTRLVLTTDGAGLTLWDLQRAAPVGTTSLRGGPLVLLNACQSAQLSPLTYAGLVPYLLDQGARAVIGTECDTPAVFGSAFAPQLVDQVITRRVPVGEALRDTRRLFLSAYHNPLGLLYALYGSADLQVSPGMRAEGQP